MGSKVHLRNCLPLGRETAFPCNRQERRQTGTNTIILVGLVAGLLRVSYLIASILRDTWNKASAERWWRGREVEYLRRLEEVWNRSHCGLGDYELTRDT